MGALKRAFRPVVVRKAIQQTTTEIHHCDHLFLDFSWFNRVDLSCRFTFSGMEADLQKKQQSSWSSGAASNAMSSSSFVDEVRLNWNKYEKNIKMRTLLSLLGVENSKRTGSNAVAIKKLLKVASEDKTDQVCSLNHLYISTFNCRLL